MECTERDFHNFVQSRRSNLIGPGDAQSLIYYFTTKLVETLFFHHELFDDENRLMNIFWSNGDSRADYDCFGDVVVFDTTYRTNKYNMICAPFVGVNHHWKNVYFGCAFLQNEKITSFEWGFKTFLEAMGNKLPKTIFTDQDEAMKSDIKNVFPNTVHRLCTWHISKNAVDNISHIYATPEFKSKFNYILNCCEVETEFDSKWKELDELFRISDEKWLKRLYTLKDKWSLAFNRYVFSANIRSTQRSESTNNVFQENLGKMMTLIEFVHQYDDIVNSMREILKENDYKCFNGKLTLPVCNNSLFKHATEVYAHKIVKMFQDEFLQCMSCRFVKQDNEGTFTIYTVKRREGSREHVVRFDPLNLVIMCRCKKFESMGLLCRHALCILNYVAKTDRIPDNYVLNMWTKNAKKGPGFASKSRQLQTSNNLCKLTDLNGLMRRAVSVMSMSSGNDKKVAIANKYLDQIEREILEIESMETNEENANNKAMVELDENIRVLDPLKKWPKGVSYSRLKGHMEKGKRKRANKTTTANKKKINNILHQNVYILSVFPTNSIPNIGNQFSYYPNFQSMMNFHQFGSSMIHFGQGGTSNVGGGINFHNNNPHHKD